jgi:hypothetical protein
VLRPHPFTLATTGQYLLLAARATASTNGGVYDANQNGRFDLFDLIASETAIVDAPPAE